MRQIDDLTDDAQQIRRLILDDGSEVSLTLDFKPATQMWTVDVVRGTKSVLGLALVSSVNLLRQWRNVWPFGLACRTLDRIDPTFVDDFSTGRAALFLLDKSDVAAVEGLIRAR